MPSSTSNSEHQRPIPGGTWLGPVLIGGLLALAIAGVAEWSLRRAGHRPSFDDDPTWWALHRREVRDDPRAVALLGSSRMLLAMSADAFAKAQPDHRLVQLAINGTAGLGSLEDLAADNAFTGIAIIDLAEWDVTEKGWHSQDRWVQQGQRLHRAPGALTNAVMRGLARERLVVLGLDGRLVLASALTRRDWPEQRWVITDRNRMRRGDYSRASKRSLAAARRKNRAWVPADPLPPDKWLAEMARVEKSVRAIQERGGRVVIVRMPTSGEQWLRGERSYPRARYWDRWAAASAAVVLHFKDVPGMAELTCPDEAHLDQRDQEQFTTALVGALRVRGVITAPALGPR